jgi:hypothetical protein
MDQNRLSCAACGRNIPACVTCGKRLCPDPVCHDCLAERTGLPVNVVWIVTKGDETTAGGSTARPVVVPEFTDVPE